MTTINLHQDLSDNKPQDKSSRIVNSGLYASIAILMLTLLVFGSMKFFNSMLVGKIAVAETQIGETKNSFTQDRVNANVDFQQRLDAIDKNLESRNDAKLILQNVAKAMISGAHVVTYENEKDDISLEISTNSFLIIAKQVLSFKESESFKNVSVSDVQRGEGDIRFTIKANIVR